MSIVTTGTISLTDIALEFGGVAPHSLSEYYGAAAGVPSSGQISLSDFYGKSDQSTVTYEITIDSWQTGTLKNGMQTSFGYARYLATPLFGGDSGPFGAATPTTMTPFGKLSMVSLVQNYSVYPWLNIVFGGEGPAIAAKTMWVPVYGLQVSAGVYIDPNLLNQGSANYQYKYPDGTTFPQTTFNAIGEKRIIILSTV